ncbi:MAG: hypothetical protein AAFO75_10655, partial [Pseudomonadota bacterium]
GQVKAFGPKEEVLKSVLKAAPTPEPSRQDVSGNPAAKITSQDKPKTPPAKKRQGITTTTQRRKSTR